MSLVPKFVPSILPTYGVTILGVLRKRDVDSNERRAILQHNATSDHSYPTAKTKTREREREREKRDGDKQREGEMTGLQ